MARIPVSGHNNEALTTTVKEVISGLDPDGDGRVFYLTRLELDNSHATSKGVIDIFDQDEASVTAANQRGAAIHVPAGDTVIVTWGDGEFPFVTNCGLVATNGTFDTLSQSASGYLA